MKKVFPVTSVIVGIVLFVILIFLVGIRQIIDVFSRIHPLYFLIYLIVSFCIFLGFVIRWWIILRVFRYKVPIFKLFLYRTAGYAVSYLTPFAKIGGEPIRTYFLSKENIEFSDAVSSVVIDKTLELTANVLFTIIGVIVIVLSYTIPKRSIGVVVWSLALFITLLVVFYYRMLLGKGFFTSVIDWLRLEKFRIIRVNRWKIRDAEKAITRFFNEHRREFIICSIISLVLWILTFLEYKVLTWVFGYHFPLILIFAVVVMIGISVMLPVPAALGTQEAGQVTLFSIVGAGGKVGFVISLITRFRDLLWTLVGVVFMYHKGMKRFIRSELKQKKDKIKWNF